MAFGLTFYVVYRKVFEGTSLTERVSVGEAALTKQIPEVEFSNLLVPVFGTKLDDDIVATAGRLAAAEREDGGERRRVAPGARLRDRGAADPAARRRAAAGPRGAGATGARPGARGGRGVRGRRGLHRGDPARGGPAPGSSKRRARATSEAIIIGGEPPTTIRGGGRLGGIGAASPAEIGAATEYVLKNAPCRVLADGAAGAGGGPSSTTSAPTSGRTTRWPAGGRSPLVSAACSS